MSLMMVYNLCVLTLCRTLSPILNLCFVDPEEDIIDVEEEDDDEDDEVDDEAVGCAAVVVEPWVERVWVVGGCGGD